MWTLVRKAYPGHSNRRYKPALDLLSRLAVAPHFETFGHRWVDSVLSPGPCPFDGDQINRFAPLPKNFLTAFTAENRRPVYCSPG